MGSTLLPTISSLPDSVRIRIYSFCDDEDLMSVSLTNRQNNQKAIGYLIGRRFKVHCGTSIYRFSGSKEQSGCLSKALYFAFVLEPQMRDLAYSVPPVDKGGIAQTLHHVQGFLLRCKSFTTLAFHFGEMERTIGGSEVAAEALGLGDADGWLAILADMLSVALGKQCEKITMVGIRMFGLAADFCPVSAQAQATLDGSDQDASPLTLAADATPVDGNMPTSTPIITSEDLGPTTTLATQVKPQERSNKRGFFKSFGKLLKPTFSLSTGHAVMRTARLANLMDPIGFSPNGVGPEANPIGASELAEAARPVGCSPEEVPPSALVAAPRVQELQLTAAPRARNITSRSHLKALKIESIVFFQNPVIDWLVDAISVSPDLEEISFFNIYSKPDLWDRVVNSITRSNLQTFRVGHTWLVRRQTGLPLSTLYHFLLRHPMLKVLDLYGLDITDDLSLFKSCQVPICTNLTRLSCHPLLVASILTDRRTNHYPSLTSITISSEHYYTASRRHPFCLDLFDLALDAIGQHKGLPSLSDLELSFATNDTLKLNPWLRKHIALTGRHSCIGKLTRVNNLVMRGDYIHTILQDETFELLPAFVNLFPLVEHLGLVEMHRPQGRPGDLRDPTEGFETVLAKECPRLVSFKKDGLAKVSLESLRTGLRDVDKNPRAGDAVISCTTTTDLVIGVQ